MIGNRKNNRRNRRLLARDVTRSSDTLGSGDEVLMITAGILTLFGLVMVYSASVFVAFRDYEIDWFIFFKQLRVLLIGSVAFVIGMRVNVNFWRRWVKVGLIVLGVVMVLQLVTPIGPVIKGTRRWIDLGLFNLQTSEIARCLTVIYLARILSDNPEIVQKPSGRTLRLLSIPFILIVLTFLQPDFSGSAIILLVVALMLFLGGIQSFKLAAFAVVICPILGWLALRNPYQRDRLIGFISPMSDVSGDHYQTFQSLVGFGRGGVFGVGLGESNQKMFFLPEPHTDFIYSIIGEEFGLIGAVAVLVAFIILFIRSVNICNRQPDRFGFLLGAGLVGSLVIYALVNIGVAIGVLPVTGIPLPFISSGGTSLVISLWSIGVLWNLSRRVVRRG